MYPLKLDDTTDCLAGRLRAARVTQRQVAVDTATMNLDRLLAAGVVPYDDGLGEEVRAAQHTAAETEAARQRKEPNPQNVAAIIDQWNWERDRKQAHDNLSHCVAFGETPVELQARVVGAMKAAPVGTKHDNKRPCQHRATRKHRGWINPYGGSGGLLVRDEAGVVVMSCSRCGVLVKVLPVDAPTEQAQIAGILLTRMSLDAELATSADPGAA